MVKDTAVSVNNIFFFDGENGKELIRIDVNNISFWAKNHHKLEAIDLNKDRLANRLQMQAINAVTFSKTHDTLTIGVKLGADGQWTVSVNDTTLHKISYVHELQNFYRNLTSEELVVFA